MADFLFSFVGRQNRVTYLFRLLLSVLSIAAIQGLSAAMGDWPFKGIFLGVLIAAAICIYLAAVTNRMQDFGTQPLVGLLLYYGLPVVIVMVASSIVGESYFEAIGAGINALSTMQAPDITPYTVIAWVTQIAAAAIFVLGQLAMLLRPGDAGTNVFGEAPGRWIGQTRPEGA